ncbi:hypothetical protein [Methanosalsum zhilinae]|uniref:hypothetical protein n=1 Tax=Methanosalsum zhilinae TaxID=39669 RepID=UPI0012F64529
MKNFHEARVKDESKVVVWGTEAQKREFRHVKDRGDTCIYRMENMTQLILKICKYRHK